MMAVSVAGVINREEDTGVKWIFGHNAIGYLVTT
jgi:hypothetical protein